MTRALPIAVAAAALISFSILYVYFIGRLGGPEEPVEIVIPQGSSASSTARLLQDKGVIGSATIFQTAAALTGLDRKLRPGRYPMRRGMPISEALRFLKAGGSEDVRVTIPEGFMARQIAERLAAAGVCPAADFLSYVRTNRLEGYLFPATYKFGPDTSAEKAARRLHDEFRRQIESEFEQTSPKPNLTLLQTVTLASIVEREAVLAAEKPRIASVYLNRMKLRMRLEADPTVQYALGNWKKRLTISDLRDSSPYNTYTHFGLPPGPICSPGLASVRAVLKPAQTDYLYFVADAKGGHVFSRTIEEHMKAKADFKREVRAYREKLRRDAVQ